MHSICLYICTHVSLGVFLYFFPSLSLCLSCLCISYCLLSLLLVFLCLCLSECLYFPDSLSLWCLSLSLCICLSLVSLSLCISVSLHLSLCFSVPISLSLSGSLRPCLSLVSLSLCLSVFVSLSLSLSGYLVPISLRCLRQSLSLSGVSGTLYLWVCLSYVSVCFQRWWEENPSQGGNPKRGQACSDLARLLPRPALAPLGRWEEAVSPGRPGPGRQAFPGTGSPAPAPCSWLAFCLMPLG